MAVPTNKIKLASIVAVAENGVIGKDNAMAWHIPSEFAYFRRMTLGKPIIMGRKSFESLGSKPLPKRTNIVVTRDPSWRAPDVMACTSLEDAIATARRIATGRGVDTIFITGGAEIYKQAMPLIDTLYLTEIHLSPEGTTFFPEFDRSQFVETSRLEQPQQDGEEAGYTITVLERKKGA